MKTLSAIILVLSATVASARSNESKPQKPGLQCVSEGSSRNRNESATSTPKCSKDAHVSKEKTKQERK